MDDVIIVHYGELALKGANRPFFEKRLVAMIREICGEGAVTVRRLYGRLVLHPKGQIVSTADILERLSHVFGVANFGVGLLTDMNWESLCAATDRLLDKAVGEPTFGVRARIADGRWGRSKMRTERELGAHIVEGRGWKVNLTDPDIWVRVEMANDQAMVVTDRQPGLGGLPLGTSGKFVGLLSGGIDSPAAVWKMMSRGSRAILTHFHSAPFTNKASQEKVEDLTRILARYQPTIDLWMVPLADCQREIVTATPQAYRVLLYRRFMMRIATRIAYRKGARALVTGEAVGQVASQTLENIRTVEAVTDLPVLRPLVAMDKEEITAIGRRVGTYEISIRPHDDCCTYLMPRKPAISSTPPELEEVEGALDVDRLVKETLQRAELIRVRARD